MGASLTVCGVDRSSPTAHARGPALLRGRRFAWPGVRGRTPETFEMMDVVYLALTGGLLALSWGLVRLCERV